MENIFFFQTQQILDTSSVFDLLKKQKICFSYFQIDQDYYLFLYAQEPIDINFLYQFIDVLQELDSKQRKIRSLRGFFLYALEIMEKGKDHEILTTNLQPFFWRKVKNIIRQNKKDALLQFLFPNHKDTKSINQDPNPRIKILEDQIQSLQNQINFLQDRICDLETNSNYALRGNLDDPDVIKSIKKGEYAMEVEKRPYLPENYTKINLNLPQACDLSCQRSEEPRNKISKTVSEDSKTDFKRRSSTQ